MQILVMSAALGVAFPPREACMTESVRRKVEFGAVAFSVYCQNKSERTRR